MKKTALLALPFAGVLFLSSCGGKTNAALSVYLVQTDALYVSALGEYASLYPERKMDLQTFPTYDEMAERLSTELMSGKGPDLLLFNSLQGTSTCRNSPPATLSCRWTTEWKAFLLTIILSRFSMLAKLTANSSCCRSAGTSCKATVRRAQRARA